MQLASLTISGGDYAKFINDGATVLKGVGAVIGVDVGGTGDLALDLPYLTLVRNS